MTIGFFNRSLRSLIQNDRRENNTSSVAVGDSFPSKGKPIMGLSVILSEAKNRIGFRFVMHCKNLRRFFHFV